MRPSRPPPRAWPRPWAEQRSSCGPEAFLGPRGASEPPWPRIGQGRNLRQGGPHKLHQAPGRAHPAGQTFELTHFSESARDGPAIGALVGIEAVHGEAKGASRQGLRHHRLHLRPLFRRGDVLVGPGPHDVGAHRAVTHEPCDVQRIAEALQRIQNHEAKVAVVGRGQEAIDFTTRTPSW